MIANPDAVEEPATRRQSSPPARASKRRWGRWLIFGIGVAAILGSVALYHTGKSALSATMQLTVTADSVALETSSEMWMRGLWASDLRISGIKAAYLPSREAPVEIARKQSLTILESSAAAGVQRRPTRIELHFPAQRIIRFARLLDDRSNERYSVQTQGPGLEITILLQTGQTIVSRGESNETLYTERGVGNQVLLIAQPDDPFEVNMSVDLSHSGRILPTAIRRMGFVVASLPGDTRAFASGIVGGDLAFLEVPEKRLTLHPGADLRVVALDAMLQSFSFRERHLDLNVTGKVSSVDLWVGGSHRSVQPTQFEVGSNSHLVRLVTGIIGACVGFLLAAYECWHKGKLVLRQVSLGMKKARR
jgi:hypothetical protein